MRDENYYRSSQTGAQPKTNKDGGTPKDCAEKMHNPAADKAPFMSGARSADKTAQAAGARKRAVNLPHRSGGVVKAGQLLRQSRGT